MQLAAGVVMLRTGGLWFVAEQEARFLTQITRIKSQTASNPRPDRNPGSTEQNMRSHVPLNQRGRSVQAEYYRKGEFKYDADADSLVGPAGDPGTSSGNGEGVGKLYRLPLVITPIGSQHLERAYLVTMEW